MNSYKGNNFILLDIEEHFVIITDNTIMITAIDGFYSVYLKKEHLLDIQKYQRNDYPCCPVLKIGKKIEVEFHYEWVVIKQDYNQVAIKPMYIDKITDYLKKIEKEKEKENER